MLDHQSPLGDRERASTAVRDHFLIQWQLNWRIVGLLCKTMSCFWTECFALISRDALEASSRDDMLTTCLVTLVWFFTYFPASRSSKRKGTVGGVRGDKSLSSLPPCEPCRVSLGVASSLVSYPQSARQWHTDSRAWHQVFSQRWANPLFSKMEETQLDRARSL